MKRLKIYHLSMFLFFFLQITIITLKVFIIGVHRKYITLREEIICERNFCGIYFCGIYLCGIYLCGIYFCGFGPYSQKKLPQNYVKICNPQKLIPQKFLKKAFLRKIFIRGRLPEFTRHDLHYSRGVFEFEFLETSPAIYH